MIAVLRDAGLGVGVLLALLAALELGYWRGLRSSPDDDSVASGQIGAIQGAILGLLGLLLAFSFAAAGSRFLERQDLITQEANAIGTAYLRADLLDEPVRSELRTELARYTGLRIAIGSRLREGLSAADASAIERSHAAIWRLGLAGVAAKPILGNVVLGPINDILDLHSTRMATAKKHLPYLVVTLLIACSALAIGVIGYGSGIDRRRHLFLTHSLAIMIALALWITIDLDRPRAGMIQVSDDPLRELKFDANAGG